MTEFTKFTTNMVQYNKENDIHNEAFSSVSLNPGVRWAKFILTDDEANANKQRVPVEEFDNLITTGKFMPIKMAEGKIQEGHSGAFPLGVITHLQKVKNTIIGLAALWATERPEDVDYIKERYDNNLPLDLSWELGYTDASVDESTGVQTLLGTRLKAVTFVGEPAYGGRTAVTALASKTNDEEEDSKLDELQKIKDSLAEALEKVNELKDELNAKVAEASNMESELEELRAYKADIEEAKERLAKVEEIKTKFSEAGIEKDEEYFTENIDRLLGMDENSFDFMLQELVAFSNNTSTEENESNSSKIPVIVNDENLKVTKEDLAKFLRDRNRK